MLGHKDCTQSLWENIFLNKNKNEHDFLTLAIKIDFDLKEKKSRNDTDLNKILGYFSSLNEKT